MANNPSKSGNLVLPLPLAWILAVIAAIAPFMVIFSPGGSWSIEGGWGMYCLSLMVLVLILFLADIVVSKIRYKPLWILFILLCPSIVQILYLILKNKMQY